MENFSLRYFTLVISGWSHPSIFEHKENIDMKSAIISLKYRNVVLEYYIGQRLRIERGQKLDILRIPDQLSRTQLRTKVITFVPSWTKVITFDYQFCTNYIRGYEFFSYLEFIHHLFSLSIILCRISLFSTVFLLHKLINSYD